MDLVESEALAAMIWAQHHRITDRRTGIGPIDGESFTQHYVDEATRYAGCSHAKADAEIRARVAKYSPLMITGNENPVHFMRSCESVQAIFDFFEAIGVDVPHSASVGLVHSYDLNFRTLTNDDDHPIFIFNSVMYDFINDVAAFVSWPSLKFLLNPKVFAESLSSQSSSRVLIESMNSILGYYACNGEYQRSDDDPSEFELIAHIGGNQMPKLLEPQEPRLQTENFVLRYQIREALIQFTIGHEVAHACAERLVDIEKEQLALGNKAELECFCDELALRYFVQQRLEFAARYSEHLPRTFIKLACCVLLLRFLGLYQLSREMRRTSGASAMNDDVSNAGSYPDFQERASRAVAFISKELSKHMNETGVAHFLAIARLIEAHVNQLHRNGRGDLGNRLGYKRAGLNIEKLSELIREKYGPGSSDS